MKKLRLILAIVALSSVIGCSTVKVDTQAVVNKLELITSVQNLKDSYVTLKRTVIQEKDVFSDNEIEQLSKDAEVIESFYIGITALVDNTSTDQVLLSLSTITNTIDTVRLNVSNAATIVELNKESLSPQGQIQFAAAVGNYNRVNEAINIYLEAGNKAALGNSTLELLRAATPILIQLAQLAA